MDARIPVIDLFAGPGGLGEGFSAAGSHNSYKIALSVEMDPVAHRTLKLRAFFREFARPDVPEMYYAHLRGDVERDALFGFYSKQSEAAEREAWNATLGQVTRDEVNTRIREALASFADPDRWVLIGGPPCQAYSLAGRSRNRGNQDYIPENDHRQFLYLEYLQILADHAPPVFVMENVKGLLSATVKEQRMFDRIREDLSDPAKALERENRPAPHRRPQYEIRCLTPCDSNDANDVRRFVIKCEEYGIPQCRHRVILLGVRSDLAHTPSGALDPVLPKPKVYDAIHGLPELRCGVSKVENTRDNWIASLEGDWPKQIADVTVREKVQAAIRTLKASKLHQGDEFVSRKLKARKSILHQWYHDPCLGGVANHSTRCHMPSDLRRYLFVACYGEAHGKSPDLADFPKHLLPEHNNVNEAISGSMFGDRFRVQVWQNPSTTVVSHISKDGHYYIHPDPYQCRSLTVREAARLQTFPDNYLFCGGRTAQYHQVGNAVPPLLAKQIAEIVYDLLK